MKNTITTLTNAEVLTSTFPLIVSTFTIGIILILSFVFKAYKYPFWIAEGGVIETLSALGYFLCALLIILKGKWSYIKQYHYFFMLIIFFGLRERNYSDPYYKKHPFSH